MFSKAERGQRGPHILLIREPVDPIRLDEARMAAWALALDHEQGRDHRPSRRPHRGQLPDIDFSRAVPAPRRPGLVKRLVRFVLGGRPAPDKGATESGADDGALGEAEPKPYLKLAAGESDAGTPEKRPIVKSWSRAA